MIDLKPYVFQTLNALEYPVHYHYPPEEAEYPCITYYEAENRRYSQADTREYLSELAFVVDVWGKTATENSAIGLAIDEAMSAAGFSRAFSYDLYEPGLHHKTLRYRALSDPDGVLYQ